MGIKTVNLLLGGSIRRINNLIEAAAREACYDQAVVDCSWTIRIDDFVRRACSKWPDLILVAPETLLPAPSRRLARVTPEEVVSAVRRIRGLSSTPILGFTVGAIQDEDLLLEAGVDNVFAFPIDPAKLETEVRQRLALAAPVQTPEPADWSLASLLLRQWQRLRSA